MKFNRHSFWWWFALWMGVIILALALAGCSLNVVSTDSMTNRNCYFPRAIDGDTFDCGGERYRVVRVDSPERGEPGYARTTRTLQRWLDYGRFYFLIQGTDRYGRTLTDLERKDGTLLSTFLLSQPYYQMYRG